MDAASRCTEADERSRSAAMKPKQPAVPYPLVLIEWVDASRLSGGWMNWEEIHMTDAATASLDVEATFLQAPMRLQPSSSDFPSIGSQSNCWPRAKCSEKCIPGTLSRRGH